MALFKCYLDVKAFSGSPQSAVKFSLSRPIRPLQVNSELAPLAQIVAKLKPKRVLEIGTAAGGTLFVWCQTADSNATIVSVDLPGGAYGGGYHWAKIPLYRAFARKAQTLHLLRADSHNDSSLNRVRRIFDGPIDFLFIDADHTYQGVRNDFEMYVPLVRKGGLIALHDIVPHPPESECEVHRFWNELQTTHESSTIVEN